MPQIVLCEGCGFVLYEGDEIKSPNEILQEHNQKCPTCGRSLSSVPINVEVKPVE